MVYVVIRFDIFDVFGAFDSPAILLSIFLLLNTDGIDGIFDSWYV